MRELNYNIQIIKEFQIGDDEYIPFLFSLDKIRAFPNQTPIVSIDCQTDYKSSLLMDSFFDRMFSYVYTDYVLLEYDKEFLKGFKDVLDYEIMGEDVKIKSSRLFSKFLINQYGYDTQMLEDLKNFVFTAEAEMIHSFYSKIIEDLEYMKEDSYDKNDIIHMFQWALGHESLNNNPFFPENMNKPTIEWSFREVELRNIYRAKEFKIENTIEKLKAKMMEDIKNKK